MKSIRICLSAKKRMNFRCSQLAKIKQNKSKKNWYLSFKVVFLLFLLIIDWLKNCLKRKSPKLLGVEKVWNFFTWSESIYCFFEFIEQKYFLKKIQKLSQNSRSLFEIITETKIKKLAWLSQTIQARKHRENMYYKSSSTSSS